MFIQHILRDLKYVSLNAITQTIKLIELKIVIDNFIDINLDIYTLIIIN